MRFLMFTKNNLKKIIIITLIFSGLSVLFGYLYASIFAEYYNYQFPNDYVYVSDGGAIGNRGYVVDQFDYIETDEVTYLNQRGIDLQAIEFNRASSNQLKDYVSEQVKYNHLAISQQYTEMADGAVLNQNNINVKMSTYDIDHIILGKFPERDLEMMVSDLFALDILNQSNLQSYDDLLDLEFEGYKIVGVYQSQYLTEFDEIIIYGTMSKRDKAAIINAKEVEDFEKINQIEYLTVDDFQVFNWSLVALTAYIVATIFTSVYILKNEIEISLRIMRCARINPLLVVANLIMPMLIITVLELIVIGVMNFV